MDVRHLTIEDVACALGYPKPAHHRQTCAACGSDEIVDGIEYSGIGASPIGTGWEVEMCAVCGEATGERRWVGW